MIKPLGNQWCLYKYNIVIFNTHCFNGGFQSQGLFLPHICKSIASFNDLNFLFAVRMRWISETFVQQNQMIVIKTWMTTLIITSWWFQTCFIFTPIWEWSILTNIFQMGWNHQLDQWCAFETFFCWFRTRMKGLAVNSRSSFFLEFQMALYIVNLLTQP